MEKFRTGRLVARSWQIEDLPLAMELWGDPAVTALIDSSGKLTEAEVQEKLYAEIEREKSCRVQYWALFDHRNGDVVGCGGLRPWVYTPGEADFEVGFHLVKRCWGKGFGTEAALGALEYAWEELELSKVYAGHHPEKSCFGEDPEEAWLRVHRTCLLQAHRLDASVLRLQKADT
jgi:ribosomal-protein-alanine N-acetyltransferase